MEDRHIKIKQRYTGIEYKMGVSVNIFSNRSRILGVNKYMRCRLCARVISHESKNRYGECREQQLCRDCGHFCEINMTAIYRYYYTGEAYRQ